MKTLFQAIESKHGFDAMREIWIEELFELLVLLQKSKRKGKVSSADIVDEIADVEICCDQMKTLLNVRGAVHCRKGKKLAELPQKLGLNSLTK